MLCHSVCTSRYSQNTSILWNNCDYTCNNTGSRLRRNRSAFHRNHSSLPSAKHVSATWRFTHLPDTRPHNTYLHHHVNLRPYKGRKFWQWIWNNKYLTLVTMLTNRSFCSSPVTHQEHWAMLIHLICPRTPFLPSLITLHKAPHTFLCSSAFTPLLCTCPALTCYKLPLKLGK